MHVALGALVLALAPIQGGPNPRDLALSQLVPAGGRPNAVWYGRDQALVEWQYRARRKTSGWQDARRYALTMWTRTQTTWVPRTLITGSPFAFVDRRAVRLADVTGDGRADVLVTILCGDCNHATAALSVFSNGRRIYGRGFFGVGKVRHPHVGMRGRVVSETSWGARRGLLWIDEPRGGSAVCCPAFRLQTFLRWTGRRWLVVSRHRVSPARDRLVLTGFPQP